MQNQKEEITNENWLIQLVKRVTGKTGDWSGEMLGLFFIAVYRRKKCPVELDFSNNLDSEGRQLVAHIINMYSFEEWDDDDLYDAEVLIKQKLKTGNKKG